MRHDVLKKAYWKDLSKWPHRSSICVEVSFSFDVEHAQSFVSTSMLICVHFKAWFCPVTFLMMFLMPFIKCLIFPFFGPEETCCQILSELLHDQSWKYFGHSSEKKRKERLVQYSTDLLSESQVKVLPSSSFQCAQLNSNKWWVTCFPLVLGSE